MNIKSKETKKYELTITLSERELIKFRNSIAKQKTMDSDPEAELLWNQMYSAMTELIDGLIPPPAEPPVVCAKGGM